MAKDAHLPAGRALLVGLGNPGEKYDHTRHNIGFDVVREVARRAGVSVRDKKFKGRFAQASVGGRMVAFLLPQTFMNLSGEAVQPCAGFFKLGVDSIVVAHDDIDLAPGVVRLKQGGGHGGHNGLRSLDKLLPARDYFRLRLGVGRPPGPAGAGKGGGNVSSWVLGRFSSAESAAVSHLVDVGADAFERLIAGGLLEAQAAVHPLRPPEVT